MHAKRIGLIVAGGLLLLIPVLPQLALAAGPGISNVQVPNVTFTAATITWTTNTTSDSQVHYGTDRPKNVTWESVHDLAGVTYHSIHLEGLTADEVYYFEVESTDGSGTATDNNGGEYYSFKTPAWYSISLNPVAGFCGEEITVTATVATGGKYHVSWDSLAAVVGGGTFTASAAGVRTLTFLMPAAKKGDHRVYLVDSTYAKKAETNFETFPSVRIDPDEGPVGTAVTLSGCGFAASQDIQVKFKDTVITTTATTGNGTWPTISYTIPNTPGGDYNFVVEVDEATWVGWAFEVTPKITAPTSGAVGRTIELKGTGFQCNEKDVEITFDGELVEPNAPIVVHANGSWEATIVVPPLHRGSYTIDASGQSTRARDVPDIEDFSVGAGIVILVEAPGPHLVGDSITVAGGGFATHETGIKVTFEGQVRASGITAKADGTWESSFVLPASAYGPHAVEASGDITKPAVTTSLSIQARILEVSPDEGAPGDLVRLTGDGFGSSQQLRVTIGGVDASENRVTQPNGNVVVSFHVPKDSIEGTQQLAVSDGSGATYSTDFTVTRKTLSTTPLPISPRDSTLRSGEVTFRWQGVTGSTGYTYTLEIYTPGTNTSAGHVNIWSKPGIAESSYTLNSTETARETLDEPGTYYWRVKIVDDYGNKGPWSDYIKFKVSPIQTWVWVVVGLVVFVGLMVVAYRETKFRVTE